MSNSTAPKVSSIVLDEATRARIAQELGFAGGVDAVPEEIKIAAVTPEDAGVEEPEVGGFTFLRQQNPYFINPSVTPAVTAERFEHFDFGRQAQSGPAASWFIVTVI
jgi:hypothetical protein